MDTNTEQHMSVRKHGNYWGIFGSDGVCRGTFASFEHACKFLAPEPAKFEGFDDEGLARYSGVSL